jgi:hypothetical protein
MNDTRREQLLDMLQSNMENTSDNSCDNSTDYEGGEYESDSSYDGEGLVGGKKRGRKKKRSKKKGSKKKKSRSKSKSKSKSKKKSRPKTNKWIAHVKAYAKKHGMKYMEAIPYAKETYKSKNPKNPKKRKRKKRKTKGGAFDNEILDNDKLTASDINNYGDLLIDLGRVVRDKAAKLEFFKGGRVETYDDWKTANSSRLANLSKSTVDKMFSIEKFKNPAKYYEYKDRINRTLGAKIYDEARKWIANEEDMFDEDENKEKQIKDGVLQMKKFLGAVDRQGEDPNVMKKIRRQLGDPELKLGKKVKFDEKALKKLMDDIESIKKK